MGIDKMKVDGAKFQQVWWSNTYDLLCGTDNAEIGTTKINKNWALGTQFPTCNWVGSSWFSIWYSECLLGSSGLTLWPLMTLNQPGSPVAFMLNYIWSGHTNPSWKEHCVSHSICVPYPEKPPKGYDKCSLTVHGRNQKHPPISTHVNGSCRQNSEPDIMGGLSFG